VLLSYLGLPGPPSAWPGGNALVALRPVVETARFGHVSVKLSGFYAASEPRHGYPHDARALVDPLFDAYGPRRLLWGSDFAPALNAVSFPQTIDVVRRLEWSPEDLGLVLGGNLVAALDRVASTRR